MTPSKQGHFSFPKGYILTANLENPGLMSVFEGILADPVTNKRLTELLKMATEAGTAPPVDKPSPFRFLTNYMMMFVFLVTAWYHGISYIHSKT